MLKNVKPEPFSFHLGSPALNFTATLRSRNAVHEERIPTPAELARWLETAELAPPNTVPTPSEYRDALRLREAIYTAASAILAGSPPPVDAVTTINTAATAERRTVQLDPVTLTRTYRTPKSAVRAALAAIADDAIESLTTNRALLATCEDETCVALIRLNPRGPRRRWCSMARCGNRHKVATYRTRH